MHNYSKYIKISKYLLNNYLIYYTGKGQTHLGEQSFSKSMVAREVPKKYFYENRNINISEVQ